MESVKRHIGDAAALLALAAIMALTAVIGFELIDGALTYIRGGDSVSYVLLAKAIATGHWYSDINIPGSPPHTQYPPLFPLILSPVYFLLGLNVFWMKAVVLAFGVGAVLGAGLLFGKDSGHARGPLVALLTGTNFYVLFFMREVMSDVPYMALSLFSVYFIEAYSDRDKGALSIAAPVFLAAAYLTRMIGITIYAAALASLFFKILLEKDGRGLYLKKLIFLGITGAVPFVLWSIRGHIYGQGVSTYGSIFLQADYYSVEGGTLSAGPLITRVLKNSLYYLDEVPTALMTYSFVKDSLHPVILKVVEVALLVVMAVGFLKELFLKRGGKDFYVLFYMALLAVWPVYGTGDARRYIVPLIPFIYFYFFAGFSAVFCRGKKEGAGFRPVMLIPLFLLLAMNFAEIKAVVWPQTAFKRLQSVGRAFSENIAKRVDYLTPETLAADYFAKKSPCYRQYMMTAYYLRAGMNSNEVIMTRKPEMVSLITGGYAVRFPFTNNADEMLGFMKEKKVAYVLVDGCFAEAGLYVRPFMDAHPEMFKVMTEDTKGTLLAEVRKDIPKPR
ncbi:MAG: glycosyltransferase family 39 protein [Deltaproteobacteria bacterium]|nr:glycosyltransferase family 39 protein [Deltaproteobacteria bacterium]